MRNNNAFKKTVRTAIALAAVAMVGTASPALVYAAETGTRVETAATEETPVETSSETPVKNSSFWDDPSGSLHRAYHWQKNHPYKTTPETQLETEPETQPETQSKTHSETQSETHSKSKRETPVSLVYTPDTLAVFTESASTAEVTAQNDQTTEASSNYALDNQMNALIREITAANAEAQRTGVNKTVSHNDITELTLPVMRALRTCPNVILDMTYTYNEVSYHSAIAGGSTVVYDENVPCYGPLWLFANYGVN